MQPLQVRVTSLAKLPELIDALTRAGYLAVQARRDVIEIHRTPSSADAREDLKAFLRIWKTMNPEAPAEVL